MISDNGSTPATHRKISHNLASGRLWLHVRNSIYFPPLPRRITTRKLPPTRMQHPRNTDHRPPNRLRNRPVLPQPTFILAIKIEEKKWQDVSHTRKYETLALTSFNLGIRGSFFLTSFLGCPWMVSEIGNGGDFGSHVVFEWLLKGCHDFQ